jgi:hypothetical protein
MIPLTLRDIVNAWTGLAQAGGAGEFPTDDCDLCTGFGEPLEEGGCSCCDLRLAAVGCTPGMAGIPWAQERPPVSPTATQAPPGADDPDLGPHPYTLDLARRVRGMLGSHVKLPGVTLLADAIEEALWFAARDLRAGREVHLHHIGDLLISDEGRGPDLGCMPDRDILRDFARGELGRYA